MPSVEISHLHNYICIYIQFTCPLTKIYIIFVAVGYVIFLRVRGGWIVDTGMTQNSFPFMVPFIFLGAKV